MLTAEIKPYFSKRELNRLGKEAGFTQRTSKLDGATFLSLIVFHREDLKSQSLNGLCLSAMHDHNIDIKKQSLHERFNSSAVLFLKRVLEELISKNMNSNPIIEQMQGFSCVRIKDSTSFQVGENATKKYPGSGGHGSSAAVRIQFEFDLLTGSILDLSLNAYNDQDAKNSTETIDSVNAGDLIIRDLAYMHTSVLRGIIERNASFMCRLHPSNRIYDRCETTGNLRSLDFESIYKKMITTGTNILEKEVYLDEKKPLKLRLILSLLPQEEVEKRIARVRQQQKKKNRNEPSKEFLIRCHFNLFLTNTGREQVSATIVWPLYKYRWLIELIFKTWKSVWKIQMVKPVIVARLECYVYSKLITIISNWNIVWKTIKATLEVAKVVISIDKCNKFLSLFQCDLKVLFMENVKKKDRQFITTLGNKINHLLMERHGKKVTLMESLANCMA